MVKSLSLINIGLEDGATFTLKIHETIIPIKAINKSAKILWSNQLQKAIEEYNIHFQLNSKTMVYFLLIKHFHKFSLSYLNLIFINLSRQNKKSIKK